MSSTITQCDVLTHSVRDVNGTYSRRYNEKIPNHTNVLAEHLIQQYNEVLSKQM